MLAMANDSPSDRYYPVTDLTYEEIGTALRNRRESLGFSLIEMGKRMGERAGRPMSGQAYSRYESGVRLKTRDILDACKALDIDVADLEEYLPVNVPLRKDAAPAHKPFSAMPVKLYGTPKFSAGLRTLERANDENVIDASSFFSGSLRAIQAPDDELAPMVEQGQIIFFDLNTIARRGDLCVIEMASGQLLIRIFESQDGSTAHLALLNPHRHSQAVPLKTIAGMYPVKLRAS